MPTRISGAISPRADERLRRLVEAPVLPRHEGARRVEEVLPVLQVEHGVARRRLVVAGRQVDRDAPRRAERRRAEVVQEVEPAGELRAGLGVAAHDRRGSDVGGHRHRGARRPRALYYRAMPVIEPGQQAPAFSLPDQHGTIHTLAGYAGRPRGALLLSEGRHLGLHQGSLHLPGDAAALRHRRRPRCSASACSARTARRSSRRSTACRSRCSPTRITPSPIATARGSRRACTAASTWASRASPT